jgi:hypothetical protein
MNEVLFGVCSNDLLYSLSSDEASQLQEGVGRVARLAGHVLEQQSFAPQFPVPNHTYSQACFLLNFRYDEHLIWLAVVGFPSLKQLESQVQ